MKKAVLYRINRATKLPNFVEELGVSKIMFLDLMYRIGDFQGFKEEKVLSQLPARNRNGTPAIHSI